MNFYEILRAKASGSTDADRFRLLSVSLCSRSRIISSFSRACEIHRAALRAASDEFHRAEEAYLCVQKGIYARKKVVKMT